MNAQGYIKPGYIKLGMVLVSLAQAGRSYADRLVIQDNLERGQRMDLPQRGMSMAQVESRYGAPLDKLSPAGGDAAQHPVIHRWRYPHYVVYFERQHVLHSVADESNDQQASRR